MLFISLIVPIVIAGIITAGMKSGVLQQLSERPILVVGFALALSIGYSLFGLPQIPDSILKTAGETLLGALVFMAALECRLSRLVKISSDALRLSGMGTALTMVGFAAAAFILIPGIGLFPPLMVGAAMMMAGAPAISAPLLDAPIEDSTRRAARVEMAIVLAIGTPIAILLVVGAEPYSASLPLWRTPLAQAVGGFAFGAAAGLIAALFIRLGKGNFPLQPLFIGGFVAFGAVALDLHPVMALAAAGIALSEDMSMSASIRTRYWRSGEKAISPLAFGLFGFFIAPYALTYDFLVWFMALVGVFGVRLIARHMALAGSPLEPADRTFLILFNGAPGIGSALILMIYATSNSPMTDRMIGLAAAAILIGVITTRIASKPLTRRLVQQTALARKRRFSAA